MSSEIDPKIIKTSQDLLSKIVKKPALNDKLLKRPPFRFLHDLICSIIKTHGFMTDLYNEEEMVAENVKEKDTKIAFLQKAIDVMGFITGDIVAVKASKIVAGLEADKTNQWLQMIAKAVADKKSSTDAVQKVLNGEKPTKQKSVAVSNAGNKKRQINTNSKTANNLNTKTKTVQKVVKTDVKVKTKNDTSSKPINKAKPLSPKDKESNIKESVDTHLVNGNGSKPSSAGNDQNDNEKDDELVNTMVNGNVESNETETNKNEEQNEVQNEKQSQIQTEIQTEKEVEIKVEKRYESESVKQTEEQNEIQINHKMVASARPTTAARSPMRKNTNRSDKEPTPARPPTRQERLPRPSSSRPAPPRVMSKLEEENRIAGAELEEKLRLLTAKPVENLITENVKDEDEDEFIVTDEVNNDEDLPNNEQLSSSYNNESQKGSLVKQLVDTKKELEGNNQTINETVKTEKTVKFGNRDIEKLKESIQSLSQCVNPLGKVLDYLQEDIDSMLYELKSWQNEYKHNMIIIEKSRNSINDDLEPYKVELNVLDSDINEQIDKLMITKANLIKNEDKLLKMVTIMNRN